MLLKVSFFGGELWLLLVLAVLIATWLRNRRLLTWDFVLGSRPSGDKRLSLGLQGNWFTRDHLWVPSDCRTRHIYVVGASGSGKSSLLLNMLAQDVTAGMGVILIDPHGDLVKDILPLLASIERDALVLDLEDTEHMLTYNPLARKPGVLVAEQVAKLVLAFKRIWADAWGARMEDILRHSLTLLIEQEYTLCDFERLHSDPDFRTMLIERTEIEQTRDYFRNRYERWNAVERTMTLESTLNKVSALLADPRLSLRFSQKAGGLNLRELIDNNGVLLVNLAKGRMADNADLAGALLMADIETTFLSRPKQNRTPIAVYADEFQNIATESFGTALTEARKFGMCLTLAHQSLGQLDPKLIGIILGNVQTQVYFRVSRMDAENLAKETHNIVGDIEQQLEKQRQAEKDKTKEPRLTLQELWEMAFRRLSNLRARRAYVTIRGVSNEPVLITTQDNPRWGTDDQTTTADYPSFIELVERYHSHRATMDEELLAYIQAKQSGKRRPKSAAVAVEAPLTLMDFPPSD